MTKLIIAIALGAAAVSTPVLAQAPRGQGGWGQGNQTRAEAKQRADMMFQMMDLNHDGVVTKEEAQQALAQFQASRGGGEGGGRGAGMMGRMVDQLFANSPSITLPQFEALMLARFDAMDLNHDGVVTPDERREFRQQNRQGDMGAPPQGAVPPPPQPQ